MHNLSTASDSLIYGHHEYGNADMEKVVSTPAVLTHKREMGCQERPSLEFVLGAAEVLSSPALDTIVENILKMLTEFLQDIKGCL